MRIVTVDGYLLRDHFQAGSDLSQSGCDFLLESCHLLLQGNLHVLLHLLHLLHVLLHLLHLLHILLQVCHAVQKRLQVWSKRLGAQWVCKHAIQHFHHEFEDRRQ